MNTLAMLIRREFWEHRMLVIAPATLCGIYILLCVLAGANFSVSWPLGDGMPGTRGPMHPGFFAVMNIMFVGLLYLLMAIVAFFYLCDSLYAERKDRSILFWKSLPVSDAMTVMSKALVALIAMPLVVYVLGLVTNLITMLVFKVAFDFSATPGSNGSGILMWLKVNGYLLVDVFVLALWFLPVVGYQLLISVLVPKAPFVWTLLPPVALMLGQKIFFDSWSIAQLISFRLGGVMSTLGDRRAFGGQIGAAIESVNAIPLLARPDLWIGVAIGAALLFAAIRIRRHRDDT
jgi:ABC-2 type transport system permease protein